MTNPQNRSNIHVGVKRNGPDLNPDSLHHDGSFGKYLQVHSGSPPASDSFVESAVQQHCSFTSVNVSVSHYAGQEQEAA